jgi:hypothetical protein
MKNRRNTKMQNLLSDFGASIRFDEKYDCEEYKTTTLYFDVPVNFLSLANADFEDASSAQMSIEYPIGKQEPSDASVMISPEDADGTPYDWCYVNLPYEHIEALFKVANAALVIRHE